MLARALAAVAVKRAKREARVELRYEPGRAGPVASDACIDGRAVDPAHIGMQIFGLHTPPILHRPPPLKHERSRRRALGEDASPHMCEVPTQDRSFGFGLANDPR